MWVMIKAVFAFAVILVSRADYWADRAQILASERNQMVGSSINLTEKEELVNNILMKHKHMEYDKGFSNPDTFLPSLHFFNSRDLIHDSEVFKMLKMIPKGAALHGHTTALVSSEYLYKLTFTDNLYACTINGKLYLKFLESPIQNNQCNWTLLTNLRVQNSTFDDYLKTQINLYTENPREKYKTINDVWKTFQNGFSTVRGLITYRPVFEKYFYQALKDLHDDNVMYMEFRSTLPVLYELNGTTYSSVQSVRIYEQVLQKFRIDYPRFKGARLIYSPSKRFNNSIMHEALNVVKELKETVPNFLAGFDLVGQEDINKPLTTYLDLLKEIEAMNVDFFFHAGETNWYGTNSDLNLVDAILLGTKRIGHGYALIKHPVIMQLVKERQIAIEVCPISNQVLMLVADMRNHPAAILLANNYPVVICNDDPTFWNAKALSYDFYMAFMGLASRDADLRLIKQLALNSLKFSSLPNDQKEALISDWKREWNSFLEHVIALYANEVLV